MRRNVVGAIAALLLTAAPAHAQEPKTYFDYVESAFAVGEIKTNKPMEYRDGMLLLIPGQVLDLVYARLGKPQSIMLVFEKHSKTDKPPFDSEEKIFAPVRVLPEYSYLRDNLPKTPHHEILGGTRYVFRGDQIEEAKRVTRPLAAALARKGAERWSSEAGAIVEALFSSIGVFREDGVRKLSSAPELLKALDPDGRERLADFLGGDAPEAERVKLIDAIGKAPAAEMSPALETLAKRDDATGAAALRALEALGKRAETPALLELTKAKSEPLRAAALEALGSRSSHDRAAFDAAAECLRSEEPVSVRMAAARGLGESGAAEAIEPLSAALGRGDGASQAVASALAAIGGQDAGDALKQAITSGPDAAKQAAVIAMVDLRGACSDCMTFLRDQHTAHPDKGIRDLIAIMLELERPHKHL